MKELGLQQVPVAEIDAAFRLRQVDDLMAAALAENITQVGRLRQPIEVRRMKGGVYRLIAGAHRLAAATLLGWATIPAFVFETTDDEARLAEIDENLVRHELNPLDRATFLAERKALYERLNPEVKNGAQGGKGGKRNETDIVSFSKDTADRLGLTDRTIRRAVMIFSKLASDVRAEVAGTWIAKSQNELLSLAKLPHVEQRAVVAVLLATDPKAKTVQAAHRIASGAPLAPEDPDSKMFERLYSAWGRAGHKARRAFLTRLNDDGVFDVATLEWLAGDVSAAPEEEAA